MVAFISRLRNIEWHPLDEGFLGANVLVALFTIWLLMATGHSNHTLTVLLSLAAGQGFVGFICLLERFGISPRPRRGDVDDLHITREFRPLHPTAANRMPRKGFPASRIRAFPRNLPGTAVTVIATGSIASAANLPSGKGNSYHTG